MGRPTPVIVCPASYVSRHRREDEDGGRGDEKGIQHCHCSCHRRRGIGVGTGRRVEVGEGVELADSPDHIVEPSKPKPLLTSACQRNAPTTRWPMVPASAVGTGAGASRWRSTMASAAQPTAAVDPLATRASPMVPFRKSRLMKLIRSGSTWIGSCCAQNRLVVL